MGLIPFNLLNTLVVFSLAFVLEVLLLCLNILLHCKIWLTLPLSNIRVSWSGPGRWQSLIPGVALTLVYLNILLHLGESLIDLTAE